MRTIPRARAEGKWRGTHVVRRSADAQFHLFQLRHNRVRPLRPQGLVPGRRRQGGVLAPLRQGLPLPLAPAARRGGPVVTANLLTGDAIERLSELPDGIAQTCITSPPYFGLRDYGVEGQIGLEKTPQEYVERLVAVFREVRRVLRDDGTLWLNLGDSYARTGGTDRRVSDTAKVGSTRNTLVQMSDRTSKAPSGLKNKDLIGIPWRVAFALQADGWYLRSDIIWHKPNAMPESVKDRPTKAHEYVFLLTKSPRYYYDTEAIKEPLARPEELLRKTPAVFGGRNKHGGYGTRKHSGNEYVGTYTGRNRRSVWTIATQPFPDAPFATFPDKLLEPCILAGTSPKACPKCGAPWERVVERIAGVSKE